MVHSFAHAAGRFAAVVSDFAVGRQFAMLGMPVSSIGLHLVGWYVIADLGPLSPLVADFTNSYFDFGGYVGAIGGYIVFSNGLNILSSGAFRLRPLVRATLGSFVIWAAL